jgi:2-methylisocitrate lyase-like PEP mutase family enzyme
MMAGLMDRQENGAKRLRMLLDGPELVLAPGAYDCLSARLVEQAGFPAAYMTGFGTAATLLGRPDVGLLTMSEMVDNARRMAQAIGVPLIADADTGYGNPINVVRTVREYEAAGVAAIHLEDQVSPKRCGHLDGKQVVDPGEMVEKVRAAVEARRSEDFVVIARTDAIAVEGLGAALERARLYREAGADALFVESPRSEPEVAAIAEAFPDVPLLFNRAETGKAAPVPVGRLRELGYRLVIFPVSALLAAAQAMREALSAIRSEQEAPPAGLPFAEFLGVVGMPEVHELERRFVPGASPRAAANGSAG